jgi:hypothetical protein
MLDELPRHVSDNMTKSTKGSSPRAPSPGFDPPLKSIFLEELTGLLLYAHTSLRKLHAINVKYSPAGIFILFKDYFFDKKKVQLFFTLEFHAAVRGE